LAASFRELAALHGEVTVSADPIGYIGGVGAKKRTPEEAKAGVEDWFTKELQGKKMRVVRRREKIAQTATGALCSYTAT
jgi:hypothetical protein